MDRQSQRRHGAPADPLPNLYPSRENLNWVLQEWLPARLRPNDIVLIYYAGQAAGLPPKPDALPGAPGRNYLLPADAQAMRLDGTGWPIEDALDELAAPGRNPVLMSGGEADFARLGNVLPNVQTRDFQLDALQPQDLVELVTRRAREEGYALTNDAKAALADAQFAPEVLSRIDDTFAFRPLKGLDIARVVALEIEAIALQFNLRIAGGGIDPQILMQAIDALSGRMQGGVRDMTRAIERQITDALIDARAGGAAEIRLVQDGERVRVETVRGSREAALPSPQHVTVG